MHEQLCEPRFVLGLRQSASYDLSQPIHGPFAPIHGPFAGEPCYSVPQIPSNCRLVETPPSRYPAGSILGTTTASPCVARSL